MPHKHEFTALWYHFGQYGPQDVHIHGCFTEGCWRVLIGEGRECDGKMARHKRMTLTEDGPRAREKVASG